MFYNAGSSGAVDLIGIKDGEVYLFDVKMNKETGRGSYASSRTPLQKKLGVQYLLFDPNTRKLRLQKHRE